MYDKGLQIDPTFCGTPKRRVKLLLSHLFKNAVNVTEKYDIAKSALMHYGESGREQIAPYFKRGIVQFILGYDDLKNTLVLNGVGNANDYAKRTDHWKSSAHAAVELKVASRLDVGSSSDLDYFGLEGNDRLSLMESLDRAEHSTDSCLAEQLVVPLLIGSAYVRERLFELKTKDGFGEEIFYAILGEIARCYAQDVAAYNLTKATLESKKELKRVKSVLGIDEKDNAEIKNTKLGYAIHSYGEVTNLFSPIPDREQELIDPLIRKFPDSKILLCLRKLCLDEILDPDLSQVMFSSNV